MAILNSIRKRGIFLIIIIALALFAFIVSDSLTKGGGGGPDIQDTVGVINGTELSRVDFMNEVENYQRSLGPSVTTAQAVSAIWDRELRSTLMQQQVDALGMTLSQEQLSETLSEQLANNPTFQNENGFYSDAKLQEYLRAIRANPQAQQEWDNYIENTTQNILQNTYLSMVRGGVVSTLVDGEQQYRFENDKVDIEFVYIPYTKIADEDVTVSEAEIEAYIRENSDEFEVEPMVDIQYVTFDEVPSIEDVEDKRMEVEGMIETFQSSEDPIAYVNEKSESPYVDRWYYNQDLPAELKDTILQMPEGSIFGPYKVDNTFNLSKVIAKKQLPDSVEARHILIPIGLSRTDSITRTKEEAKKTADSVLRIVRADRSKFEDLVGKLSSDVGSIARGGHYDMYPYQQMVAPFRDFTFENPVGSLGVVESQFGYHVIEVEGQTEASTLAQIATLTIDIEPTEQTLSDVFSEAAKFEEAAREKDYNTVAQENGLTPNPVNRIGKLDATIPGIGNDRSIVNWAFEEDTDVGDVKRLNVNDKYVIAQLTRKNDEKALMSIAEASGVVTPILRKEKKAEKIRSTITGSTLQEIASSQNVTVKTANAITRSAPTLPEAGTEPKVVGAAFGKGIGEMTKLIDGENGVFIVQVISINKAPDLDNYANYATQLQQATSGAVSSGIFEALKKAADIEDNRADFY